MAQFYITKYALTGGIQLVEAIEVGDGFLRDSRSRFQTLYHGEGREWHRTYASALGRAEEMRIAKSVSLRKSLAKLEKLRFEEPSL